MPGFTSANKYRAQWIFFTPPGFRDDFFVVPFVLEVLANGVIHRGLPVQLDDDAPYIVRSIMLPDVGPLGSTPALLQLLDSYGNPLQSEPCLGGGFGGEVSADVSGFPLDHPLFCPASGILTWNIAVSNNATQATSEQSDGGLILVIWTAVVVGTAGNALTIELIDPAAINIPLSVAVIGNAIEVTLATDGAGAITSTVNDVAALIALDVAASAVVTSEIILGGTEIDFAFGPQNFSDGVNASTVTIRGEFRGVKRFPQC